ncbi:MAG: hypothetical protein RR086_02180, partial [Clostridia bacterium]
MENNIKKENKPTKKRLTLTYRFFYGICKVFFPRVKVTYLAGEPTEPCVFIANHAQLYGPVEYSLAFKNKRIWSTSEICNYQEAYEYMYNYAFIAPKRHGQWWWKMWSRVSAKLIVKITKDADVLPVFYNSHRIITTFHDSVESLQQGKNIIIQPEKPVKYTDYIFEFSEGFVSLGSYYLKHTGKTLAFYPTYLAVQLKTILVGEPINYDPTITNAEFAHNLMIKINDLAMSLPKHKAIPFYS